MPKNFSAQIFGTRFLSSGKRRPAGVSRRDKHRRLQIETLEARQVMSATPISYDYDHTDVVMRNLLLDSAAIKALTVASNISQYSEAELARTTQWVVFTELGTDLSTFATDGGFTVTSATDIVPGSFIVTVGQAGHGALISALSGEGAIDYFYPLVPIQLEETAVVNDPLFERQWHLVNYGQEVGNPNFGFLYGTVGEDINVTDAWNYYTGAGVVVGVVDSGTQMNHPDLVNNLRPDLAIDLAAGDNLPNPSGNDAHGTAVAGLIAAEGNNNQGGAGVAYNAELAPIRLFSDDPFNPIGTNDFLIAQALLHQFQEIDIYNHSWGIPPIANDQGVIENPRAIIDFGPLSMLALRNSVFFGRGGLGSIHVFAAGNSSGGRDAGNNSGLVNSRYTISVGGVIHDGTAASYAEAGAAILVVAPTGSNPETIIRDNALGSGLTTTDITGNAGYNQAPVNGQEVDADYLEDTDYSSRFNGTSAAAPLVSGVIALMLEANPNLTYRDVQHILVRSARQNDANDISWITNPNEFFADPLAFDSDGHLPVEEQDGVFDGAWPYPVLGAPNAETPIPDKFVYYQELRMPAQFTNGAGFTVSQMTTNTEYGYGHGVVDAALAVELARNWVTLGGQQSEYTWTTGGTAAPKILPAAISSDETGRYRIPGGVSPNGDGPINEPNAFIDFLDEFGEEDEIPEPPGEGEEPEDPDGPFSDDDPPVNTRDAGSIFYGQNGIPITGVPSMQVEWIDVFVDIAGDENAMDFLRISLISPDGTVSELKAFDIPNVNNPWRQNINFDAHNDPAGVLSPGTGGLTAVFTTNRHWGERTEAKPRLNTDGTPVRAFNPQTGLYDGAIIVDGWRLVFENFSDAELDIRSYEIAFHGIATQGTGRIQGTVGVDDNGDGLFSATENSDGDLESNFTRYLEFERQTLRPGSDPLELLDFRYVGDGSYQYDRISNPNQESWAAGIIVYADLDLNGVRDATDPSFQVGADGNYYFDLPAGIEYQIRIDPASLTAAGLDNQQNRDAVSGVLATAEITVAGERVMASRVVAPDIAPGVPADDPDTILAGYYLNAGIISSAPALNIMLVANAKPANAVKISGVVYADLNQNGVDNTVNGNDVPLAGATVYIDVNQNGVYTPGVDPYRITNAKGEYFFGGVNDPNFADGYGIAPGYYSVRVLAGTTGTFTDPFNPDPAVDAFFFAPQTVRNDVDFGFIPGPPGGGGPSGTVAISGIVFNDRNESGTRQNSEGGLAVGTVYIDANNNNQLDDGEQTSTPGTNGSFFFNALPPGTYTIRMDLDPADFYFQTVPVGENANDFEYVVTLTSGSVATNLLFGLKNSLTADWGDLPDEYLQAYQLTHPGAQDASHQVDYVMWLGAKVDTELGPFSDGNDALGDDNHGEADEDGVSFGILRDDSTTLQISVTASTNGGWLQAWFDWNEDGFFDVSERVFDDQLLAVGVNTFTVNVPTSVLTDGIVFARFRYGEQGIDSPFGPAQRGEVEDYALVVQSTAPDPGVSIVNGPDFDGDGDVDGRDFLAWQRGAHITSGATAADGDANNDGRVDSADLQMWQRDYGSGSSGLAAVMSEEDETLVNQTFALIVDTDVNSVEASAHESTFGVIDLRGVNFSSAAVAGADDEVASDIYVEIADLDAAFDADLPTATGAADDDFDVLGEEAESEEDDAFALAFEGNDWLQF